MWLQHAGRHSAILLIYCFKNQLEQRSCFRVADGQRERYRCRHCFHCSSCLCGNSCRIEGFVTKKPRLTVYGLGFSSRSSHWGGGA
jgi:hypothetical protein